MTSSNIDISVVKKLLELLDSHSLEELFVEEGDLAITVRGLGAGASPKPVIADPAPQQVTQERPSAVAATPVAVDEDIVDIKAPLVGVFYRSPSPDAPPFVEVGDHIEVGTEIGLIEAMKVFSPIPSEVAGEVVEIPAEDARLVKQGDVLVRVRVRAQE